MFLLVFLSANISASVTYDYDPLHRLTKATYTDGTEINYTYDPAGNMLTRTVTAPDLLPPLLTITSPSEGSTVYSDTITVSGTATDCGQGDSGIASVTVNGLPATGGSATDCDTAEWSTSVTLATGSNTLTVTATDGSPAANQATENLKLSYLILMADADDDGMPDTWETAHGVSDPNGDADFDGVTNRDEYLAGTDPKDDTSKPEGADGVNYVLLQDSFDDAQYSDRWDITQRDPELDYTLTESGEELAVTLQQPATDCKRLRLEHFGAVDAVNTVYHASLQPDGYGQTVLGFMRGGDFSNRIEVVLDNDLTPYLAVRSWDEGIASEETVALPEPYRGVPVDLRIAKAGEQYAVFVNSIRRGTFTNSGLGDQALRPFIEVSSCTSDAGILDTPIKRIELLVDRDADGLADTHEDTNADGVTDAGESDPLNPDSDSDTVSDGYDNCLLANNGDQRDSNVDGYGNICDPDFNNNGIVDPADFSKLKVEFGSTTAPDQDLNGNGIVDPFDFSKLKSYFGKPPGPSGLVP